MNEQRENLSPEIPSEGTQVQSQTQTRQTPSKKGFLDYLKEPFQSFTALSASGKVIVVMALLLCLLVPTGLAVVHKMSHPTSAAVQDVPGATSDVQRAAVVSGAPGATEPAVTTPAAAATPTQQPTPTPAPTPAPTLNPSEVVVAQFGDESAAIAELQGHLMSLGYMEKDEPTEYFGYITKSAVLLFQRQHGFEQDGVLTLEQFDILMSDEAQTYMVMLGDSGTDVTELQNRLFEMGYMQTVTGFFGEQTEDAVRKFQANNNLVVDGRVGGHTREALYSGAANANFAHYDDKKDVVKSYQQYLSNLGYLTTTPDGVYGTDTRAAVARFQEINGLISDGYLGPSTTYLLKSGKARANGLAFGMSGDDVKNMQKLLANLGYMKAANATGYFGEITENAVKNYQQANKLGVDGIVGKNTMSALRSGKSAAYTGGGSYTTTTNTSKLEKFISVAQSKLGCTYVFAAKGPNTFDCSGFVYYCLNQAGINQSYMTSYGWAQSTKYTKITSTSNLQRGDVLVFDGHVGIYLGNGGMIDASSGKGMVVQRSNIWSSNYWNTHFICGFRIF